MIIKRRNTGFRFASPWALRFRLLRRLIEGLFKKTRRTEYSIRLAFEIVLVRNYLAAAAFERAVNRDL